MKDEMNRLRAVLWLQRVAEQDITHTKKKIRTLRMPKVMLCFQEVQKAHGANCKTRMHVFRTVRFGSVCGVCTPLKRQAPRAAVSAARNTAA